MWTHILVIIAGLEARWRKANRNPEGGYASEAVLVTALLVVGAIVVITIIVTKVTAKASEIDLGLATGWVTGLATPSGAP